MKILKRFALMAVVVGFAFVLPLEKIEVFGQERAGGAGGRGRAGAAGGAARGQMEVWVPMPVKPNTFVPPHKALTKLSDLLAKHKGQQNWKEVLVNDHLFHAEYISMAAGGKTPRQFHQDHRVWWVVQDGQIRFTIEGQEPFVASKGFMVQVPKRLIYSLETVGDRPSLRFEVTNPAAQTMYPADETPTPVPGVKFERARVASAKGSYDEANVPYIDYNLTIAGTQKPKRNPTQFIGDAHDGGYVNVGIVNIIRGDPKTQKPAQPGDKGHFHLTGPEAWFMIEGQNEFLIGDVPLFVANQGDVVYAPAQTWHRPRHVGDGMATRLAIVGYANSHVDPRPREAWNSGRRFGNGTKEEQMSKLRIASVCVVSVLAMAAPAASQSTQAAIMGVVADTSSAILPGVTVIATGPALQVPQVQTITNDRGEYRLGPLPIGTYNITYELPGFQTVRREGVRLSVGFVATLDQVMSLGTVSETVTVTGGSPLVDVTNPATSVDLSSEALEVLPTTRDGLKAFMAQVPGMSTNLDVGASSMTDTIVIRAYGQQGAPWQMLEGILFASSGGSGVQGAHVDFNAIESTRLQTVGSSAEMPRRGPFIDSVAKSGGNEFHGELVAYGSSDQLEGGNVNDALTAAGVRAVPKLHGMWDYSGAFGGRLIRNKLWFFLSGRSEGYNREILNAFRDDGSPVLVETDQAFHAEKLQWQASQSNKITLFYHGALDIQRRGASQFRPVESMEIHRGPVSMYKGEWQHVRGNSMVAQLQYGNWYKHAFYYSLPIYEGTGTAKVSTIDTGTQFVTGTHLSDNRVEDYFRNHAKGSLSFFGSNFLKGTHQLKTGFDYLFGGYPHKQGNKGGGNYQLRFNNGTPSQIETYNYPVRPANENHYLGVFAQDSWNFNRRLTLSLGLRYAYDNAYAPPQCNVPSEFGAAQCWDKIQMRIWHSWVPRVHAAFDLFGDGKSVIKGGFGRFVNLREVNPEVVTANRNNRATSTWTWRDLNNNRLYDRGEVNLDPNGPDFRGISGVTDAVPNPNEDQPKSDEWSLTFERELVSNWSARATGVYAKNFNLRRLEEIYRPYTAYNIPITNVDPGPDGSLATTADNGGPITYWEYPVGLTGRNFAGTMLVNWPGSQTYKTLEVAGTKRMSNRWQSNLSLSLTKLNAPFDDRQPLNPNSEINTANEYWEYTGKISGGYILPFEIVASANFERRQGSPQARQHQFTGGAAISPIVLNVEPIGSIRLPTTNLVDFRFAKRLRMRGSHTLEGRFDFFNVFNANFVTTRNLRSGSTYLVPSAIILPRILQVGVTYNF